MLKLYINGRFLSQKMTGQQRFSLELVAALDRWLGDERAAAAGSSSWLRAMRLRSPISATSSCAGSEP